MAARVFRRIIVGLMSSAGLIALATGCTQLKPHATVNVAPQGMSAPGVIDEVTEVMTGLGYKRDEFISVRGKPVQTEDVSFQSVHHGLRPEIYADALRNSPRSTVLVRPGSSRMHFTAGLTEAWVTVDDGDVLSLNVDMRQTTNQFVVFDEFGRREYQLLVRDLRERFGPENVRPRTAVD